MSLGLIILLGAISLLLTACVLIKLIRIVPECPQCEKIGEIYDSSIRDAWLDCRCLSCSYKWRIE